MIGNFFPVTLARIYGGATRSRTGLNGFAIGGALHADGLYPVQNLRADRLEGQKRALCGNFFPVRAPIK